MKKIISALFVLLVFPSVSFALCGDVNDIRDYLEGVIAGMGTGDPTQCDGGGAAYRYELVSMDCGPGSRLVARDKNGTSQTLYAKGTQAGCDASYDCGFYATMGNKYVSNTLTCPGYPDPEDTYSKIIYTVPCYGWCECEDCIEEDPKFCILAAYRCPNGHGVGLEYVECDEETGPGSNVSHCGNTTIMQAMQAGEHDGTIIMDPCQCTLEQEDIDNMCANLYDDCDLECENDSDCDGVEDPFDMCPGTDPGVDVDDDGCPIQEDEIEDKPDSDDDGVPDEDDECPDTPEGDVVGPDGCTVDDPNEEEPGGGTGDDDGDSDDDNWILKTIADWLKSINKHEDNQTDILNDIKNKLNKKDDLPLEHAGNEGFTIDNAVDSAEDAMESTPDLSEYSDMLSDEHDLYTTITDIISNNPITDALTGINVNASGDCSLSFNAYGQTISLSLCQYASALNIWGSIILMLANFHAVLIIFRR
jgi:hypothetical protein